MGKILKPSVTRFIVAVLLMVGAIMFVLPAMNGVMESATGTTVSPDSDFFYGADRLEEIRVMYGESGGAAYFKTRATFDVIWPGIYLFFMINAVVLFSKEILKKRTRDSLLILSVGAVALDFCENIFCSLYFNLEAVRWIGITASISSALKWVIIAFVMSAIIALGIISGIKRMQTKSVK